MTSHQEPEEDGWLPLVFTTDPNVAPDWPPYYEKEPQVVATGDADEVALLDAQLAHELVELLLADARGAGAVEHVNDRQARLLDAVRLAAEHPLRGERQIVRRDPQAQPVTPVRQRTLRLGERRLEPQRMDAGDAIQVALDRIPRVADIELRGAGEVRVDELAQVQPALGRGVLQRVKQLAVGVRGATPSRAPARASRARGTPTRAPGGCSHSRSSSHKDLRRTGHTGGNRVSRGHPALRQQ